MRRTLALLVLGVAFLVNARGAVAAPCTAKEFADAVDQSGASLRTLTLEAQPKLQDRLKRYKEVMKLSDMTYENSAFDAIQDSTLDDFDKKSSELLLRVDSLGRVPEGTEPDCAKLEEVKMASAQLSTIIKAKSDYILKRLDEKIAEAERNAPAASTPPEPRTAVESPKSPPLVAEAPPPAVKKPAAPAVARQAPPAAKPAPSPHDEGWATHTKPDKSHPPTVAMTVPDLPPPPPPLAEDGYTIDEIRDATRGFFGSVSTNLASVIEHAFKQSGRPTAYVLGIEGGGAFLAGLRFGEGTLYMRSLAGTRKVYWHGPSLGTDLGASGSRTLFLIYGMDNPDAIYRNFTGIDGSAYFVGGVGLTLLKGGPIVMAPIRSGVGMRLGANLGYLRFTEKPTWNPF